MGFLDYLDDCLTVCLKLILCVMALGFMFMVLGFAIMIMREALSGTLISELHDAIEGVM